MNARYDQSILLALVAVGLAWGPACSNGLEPGSDSVETSHAAIVNGTTVIGNHDAVAVYRQNPTTGAWSVCTGTILQVWWGWTAVLTGRQCITTNGILNGPLLDPSMVKLTVQLSPGPTPPADAVSANYYDTQPTLDVAHDAAIVWTPVELMPTSGPDQVARLGYAVGTTWALQSSTFSVGGYGNGGSGTGVLHGASYFPVSNLTGNPPLSAGTIWYVNQTTENGQTAYLTSGDEGAAMIWSDFSPYAFEMTGVIFPPGRRGSTGFSAAVAGFSDWIQDAIWVSYVSPVSAYSYNLGANGDPPVDTGWLYGRHSGDLGATRLTYHTSTRLFQFWGTNLCLAPDSGYVRIRTCDGSTAQQWNVDRHEISNVESGLCLHDGEWPFLGDCDGSLETKWMIHGTP
jgi:hypothetical protein